MLRVVQGDAADGIWRGCPGAAEGTTPRLCRSPQRSFKALEPLGDTFSVPWSANTNSSRCRPALPVLAAGPRRDPVSRWPRTPGVNPGGGSGGRQSRPGRRPAGSGASPAAGPAAGAGGPGPRGAGGGPGGPGAAGPRGRCGPGPPGTQTAPALRPPAGRDGPSGPRARPNHRPAPRRSSQWARRQGARDRARGRPSAGAINRGGGAGGGGRGGSAGPAAAPAPPAPRRGRRLSGGSCRAARTAANFAESEPSAEPSPGAPRQVRR